MLLKIENPQRLMREHHMGVGLSPALRIKLICIDMMLLIMSSLYHNSFSCQLKFSFFSCLSVRVCKELSIFFQCFFETYISGNMKNYNTFRPGISWNNMISVCAKLLKNCRYIKFVKLSTPENGNKSDT